jgi:hypothetical protein
MNRPFICLIMLAILALSLNGINAQEGNASLLNVPVLSNASSNLSSINDTSLNATQSDVVSPVNDTVSSGVNQSIWTTKTLGTGTKDNCSAFRIATLTEAVTDVSKMWYVIQSKPHGYV